MLVGVVSKAATAVLQVSDKIVISVWVITPTIYLRCEIVQQMCVIVRFAIQVLSTPKLKKKIRSRLKFLMACRKTCCIVGSKRHLLKLSALV